LDFIRLAQCEHAWASWKDSWVSRKVLILTACSAKQVRCPFFSIGSDASYDFGTVYSSNNPLLVCGLTFLLQAIEVIHGLISFCTHSEVSLHLSNFWLPYDLANLSIWNSSSSLSANVSSGAGENLIILHHMIITFPAELWGLISIIITHILVYLWGLLLAGGMTEKKITSLCYLLTLAWIFPTVSAVYFLGFAFLAITFWSKECVPTWFLSAGIMHLCFPQQELTMCLRSWARTITSFIFLHELIACYEQASSRTSWLKAFLCKPCKPCKPKNAS